MALGLRKWKKNFFRVGANLHQGPNSDSMAESGSLYKMISKNFKPLKFYLFQAKWWPYGGKVGFIWLSGLRNRPDKKCQKSPFSAWKTSNRRPGHIIAVKPKWYGSLRPPWYLVWEYALIPFWVLNHLLNNRSRPLLNVCTISINSIRATGTISSWPC